MADPDTNYLRIAESLRDNPYNDGPEALPGINTYALLSIAQSLVRLADQGDAQTEALDKIREDRKARGHG